MKYAGKTFTLYASEPVAVQGSDSLYTYQNTGTGTATLQGSNNGKDWVTITTVTSGASSISSHSYAFLRMTGSTEVSVSRGEAGSGSTLLNGSAVSSSNPLPVQNANASPTNRSGTITTGGAAQVAMAALSTRKAYFFQNVSSEIMWGSFTGTAAPNTSGSFPISPNGIIRSTQVCETTALSIYGATTGQKFTMWEM